MKTALQFDALMDDLEFGCPEEGGVKSFDEFLEKLEKHLVPLNYSFSMIQLLSTAADNYKFPIIEEVTLMYDRVRKRRFNNQRIFDHMQKVPEEVEKNRFKMRFVSRYILEGKMKGLDSLEQNREGLTQNSEVIHQKLQEFVQNVSRANVHVQEFMVSPSVMETLPTDFVARNVNLLDDDGPSRFLENCSDRFVRNNFWRNINKRGLKDQNNNSVLLEEIRSLRNIHAKALGFDNFLSMAIEGRMAGSVENIRAMVNTLHLRSSKSFENDIDELTNLAERTSKSGEFDKLQPWDVDYFIKQARSEAESKNVNLIGDADTFTLDSTLKSVFSLCSRLFHVDIEEVPKDKFQSWNPEVRMFDIVMDKRHRASFYLDPYSRESKKLDGFSSTNLLLPRSDYVKCKPLSALVLNLPPPVLKGKDVNLSFLEVVKLFGSFGSVLQHSLTDVPFSEINGLVNIEWDALRTVPEFMQFWPQYDLQTLKECSQSSISQDIQETLVKDMHRFSAIYLRRNIYRSALDLSIHSNTDYWGDIVAELWETYMKPFERNKKEDQFLCSSIDIICRQPASVYTDLWSKILAGDLYAMFQDNAGQETMSHLGLQFRDYFLSQSGGCSSAQLFKSFTERNPSVEGFMRLNRSCLLFD